MSYAVSTLNALEREYHRLRFRQIIYKWAINGRNSATIADHAHFGCLSVVFSNDLSKMLLIREVASPPLPRYQSGRSARRKSHGHGTPKGTFDNAYERI